MNRLLTKIGWRRAARLLQRYPNINQFFIFACIGVFNTIIDFSVYFALTRFLALYYILANFFSFATATTFSFFTNKRFTFRDRSLATPGQYMKFFVVTGIGFFLNTTILFLSVDYFKLHDIAAKILAVGIVLFWNFSINKLWTFRSVRHAVSQVSDTARDLPDAQ
ncbi:MAG: hypothetical protein A3F54_05195 [Candidatus Kerfeldbacteria bacterium RIFCSPHIGHO2_12_FULL_48_17]|uniref:GtrA/DPMS transmembrane domain-containing protein n=1 Tax=Candidatus Kerfeldbacteria bacterium RIFCSPHIGHO2_12_FULL_48_17 TaxID=1798542 RepID=A0A1G2B684_9BACT|nr:MAG: hypothetical protein A3F54_05195 [Candidatus Kerfeldbacteria bacterium RIFCSPHIGHO2_12_FULL_48_17]